MTLSIITLQKKTAKLNSYKTGMHILGQPMNTCQYLTILCPPKWLFHMPPKTTYESFPMFYYGNFQAHKKAERILPSIPIYSDLASTTNILLQRLWHVHSPPCTHQQAYVICIIQLKMNCRHWFTSPKYFSFYIINCSLIFLYRF